MRCWIALFALITVSSSSLFSGEVGRTYPPEAGLLDVTKPPFNAQGDGVTDDTDSIQSALNAFPNGLVIVFLPKGKYLISNTLRWPKGPGGWEYKNIGLEGENRENVVIKLKDSCASFADERKPKPMIWTGPEPAQRFGINIRNLTVDAGRNNPGAIGIQFNANNTGTLREVTIRSDDGVYGLDMSHVNEIGPCLIKNISVIGFDTGMRTGNAINSQTFEFVSLSQQRKCGWHNSGQVINARGVKSNNKVTAIYHESGTMTLIDSELSSEKDVMLPAVLTGSGSAYFVRNLRTSGYENAIVENRVTDEIPTRMIVAKGPTVGACLSHKAVRLTGDETSASLGLAIEETPDVAWDEHAKWVSPTKFGAKASDKQDDTEAIIKACFAGNSTVYFPNAAEIGYPEVRGGYVLKKPLRIGGSVRRIIGCEAGLKGEPYWSPTELVIEDGDEPVVVIERLQLGKITNNSPRTVVIRHCVVGGYFGEGKGKVFFEDVCCAPIRIKRQQVWARQLNTELVDKAKEDFGPHIINDGGKLWILGLKTEGGGTLIETKNGGSTEILGAHFYTTHGPNENLDPMFVNDQSFVSIFGAECNFSPPPYGIYIRENRGKEILQAEGALFPTHFGSGRLIPMYVGRISSTK